MALSVVANDLPGVAQVHAFFSYVVIFFRVFFVGIDPCFVSPQELETRSLRKSVFLRWERDVWDQL